MEPQPSISTPSPPSLHLNPKQGLTPSCTVFPDYTPPPPTLPSPTRTPSTPSPTAASRHDYFSWLSQPVIEDVSTPAPTSPDSDLHPSHDVRLGAWYSFAHGLHSSLGTSVFSDQYGISYRLKGTSRRARYIGGHNWLEEGESESDDDDMDGDVFLGEERSSTSRASASRLERIERARDGIARITLSSTEDDPIYSQDIGEVTAEMAGNGVDVQGIPWANLPFSREDYRATRLRETNRREMSDFMQGSRELVKDPRRGAKFYNFFHNTRKVRCSIVHFQLRNLAWATSKHDVFVMHDAAVMHWDAAAKKKTQVLDLSGSGTAVSGGLGMVQISTMIAKDDLVIAGGFYGEMIAKNLKTGTIIHNKRITYDENAITNAIDIFDGTIMTSNNDCYVRCFDIETFEKKSSFGFVKPVNHATRQPNGKMVAVAGDENQVQVIDGDNGDRIAQLHGHEDFSFATGWHPDGRMFATGSQDRTCRVWDVRNMSQSFSVLGAHTGAVRSLRFSSCGRFLVMAEPRDFVHIFDVNRGGFDTCQEIDLFGEIAGIALSPSSESLFVAVSDRTYSSLLEYGQNTNCFMSEFIF